MQTHQYVLAAGIAWLFTLIALPFLFATARRRAFDHGHTAALAARDTTYRHRIETLNTSLATAAESHYDELRMHLRTISALRKEVSELEARVMSYTGLAVTRTDYEHLKNAAETLRLARNTWQKLQGTEPWCARAYAECQGLLKLASRVHAELRTSPSSAIQQGDAA
ncbi:MAG: hypothetical protein ABS977_02725 [Pseudomonas qingdaonensis]|uniref:hypothetical protein n=1 Tax=Pseudomonas qingdaonensis TaxID=2056231 RepID=UPI003316302F